MAEPTTAVLPDVLCAGLALVICGSAAGTASARQGAYYAGPGNRFWPILHATGLTPVRLAPADFGSLPRYGIGLTDIAKTVSGPDHALPSAADRPAALRAKIQRWRPRLLAFNGKRAAAAFMGIKTGAVSYGVQSQRLGGTAIHVLPSTSAAARRYWDDSPWYALAEVVAGMRSDSSTQR